MKNHVPQKLLPYIAVAFSAFSGHRLFSC